MNSCFNFKKLLPSFLISIVIFITASLGFAQTGYLTPSSQDEILLAQSDSEEVFDPFSDYSEFDEASDEEADLNFFRHGRFFTVGLTAGYRGFTGNFSKAYGSGPAYGVYLTYFFDLRFAFSLGFQTGDHPVNFATNLRSYSGNVSFTSLNFDLKYYLNTQNVTRGLADLNPYLLGGFSQFYRTYTIDNIDGYSRDAVMGLDVGAGIEIPLMRRKAYFGIQGVYHYVTFGDETKDFVQGSERLESRISGDMFDVLFILGVNF